MYDSSEYLFNRQPRDLQILLPLKANFSNLATPRQQLLCPPYLDFPRVTVVWEDVL